MSILNKEYYGDDFRWFVATVIDNSPPYGLEGRVQVRIHGIHSGDTNDIPQKDLPWAQVMTPSDTFGGSGFGTHCQILPSTLVFGMFLDGTHSQLPMVLGSLPRVEYPTSVQAAQRQDISTNSFAYDFVQSNSQMQDPVFYINNPGTVGAPLGSDPAGVVRFFIDNGMTSYEACSITAVLYAATELNQYNESNGFGIVGYPTDSSRYARFVSYIQRLSPSRQTTDYQGQLMYVLHELKTSRSIAYSKMIRTRDMGSHVFNLAKYYLHPLTPVNIADAIALAHQYHDTIGGR